MYKMPWELVIVATAIGLGRALFGDSKRIPVPVRNQPQRDSGSNRAEAPSPTGGSGWVATAWRVVAALQRDRVMLVAAGVTFYGLLALFPATAALVSLYGLFTDASRINEHITLVSGFLPEGALEIITDQVQRILDQGRGTLSFAFFTTFALSVWSANSATKAVFDALNIIYGEREKRSFIWLTLSSLLFTLSGLVLVVIAMAGIVVVPVALQLVGAPKGSAPALLSLLRWPLLYLVILFALASIYRFGPSRTRLHSRWLTLGSAIAAGIWLAGSLLLSWYVANFGTFNATYGSLGAVIGFLVWLWLSTIVVLSGAEIDAQLEVPATDTAVRQTRRS